MAKNVVEEFFIKLTADTKGATKDINSAMSAMVKKATDLKKRANKVDVQTMKQATAQKIDAEKQYNTVAYALNKKRQQEDDAAYKRSVDSAKVAYKKKVAITKNAVDKLVKVEDTQMKAMRAFYKQQEAQGKRAEAQLERLRQKAKSIMRTAYAKDLEKLAPRLHGSYEKDMQKAIQSRNAEEIRNIASQMRDSTREMKRSIRGLAVVQNGLTDSTRNMIRSYASLFALWEGTTAIKRVGMDFQGMEASMLAASGSVPAAAKDMLFINSIVDEMGLNLKDTTDAFVKFKFAARGKMSQGQQEELFKGLSMFGTSMKVGNEDMKRAQRALTQIDYCLAA